MTQCTIRQVAQGVREECPADRCVFWDPGTPWTEGMCLLARLGVDVRRPDLAAYLLETRERLDRRRNLLEAEQAHTEFSRRLGRDV